MRDIHIRINVPLFLRKMKSRYKKPESLTISLARGNVLIKNDELWNKTGSISNTDAYNYIKRQPDITKKKTSQNIN